MKSEVREMRFPLKPVPKARPRVTSRGTFTPKGTRDFERVLKFSAKQKWQRPMLEGPLGCQIIICIERETKAAMKRDLPCVKPDLDNFAKAVYDALEGVAFKNDSQVCYQEHSKVYHQENGIIVRLFELGKDFNPLKPLTPL